MLEQCVLDIVLDRDALSLQVRGPRGDCLTEAVSPWEAKELDGIRTYTLLMIWPELRSLFRELSDRCQAENGESLSRIGAMRVRAMGGGYMPFHEQVILLETYRGAWDPCPEAAAELTEKLGAAVPETGAVAHLYRAMKSGEKYVPVVDYVTTLGGYVHWRLTGFRSLDRTGAAGMFPLDASGNYDSRALDAFDALAGGQLPKPLEALLPEVLQPGEGAGALLRESIRLLDPSGELEEGIPFLPPEEI